MRCPIRFTAEKPNFDVLPVIKFICPTDVPAAQRIFCQAQLAMTQNCFIARLAAFESLPQPDSRFELVLCGPAGRIVATAGADQSLRVTTPKGDRSCFVNARHTGGEDLQGVYWGSEISIPREFILCELCIEGNWGETALNGNIFKRGPGACAVFAQQGTILGIDSLTGTFFPVQHLKPPT
jgi:hypothetical protein